MRFTLSIGIVSVLLIGSSAWAAENILLQDDFESGLNNWTEVRISTADDEVPQTFPGPNGSGILGPNTDYPGSTSVGYSSNQSLQDRFGGNWLQMQFPGELPPGVYNVTFELDAYVYRLQETDPWGVGNRVFVLTDSLYDNPTWNFDQNPIPAGEGIRGQFWPGWDEELAETNDFANNGVWFRDYVVSGTIDTTTGNIEIRLLLHDKNSGPQTVAWDNIDITIGTDAEPNLWTFSEDFEEAGALDAWTVMSFPPVLPEAEIFAVNDPDLLGDLDSPGSQSAGWSSDLPEAGATPAAWLQQQLPEVVEPGTYTLRWEMDWYVKKNHSNPWAVGNRVYVLWDDLYDQPDWNYDTGSPGSGITWSRWGSNPDNADNEPSVADNGKWTHLVHEQEFTTTTGNIEVRLLIHNKEPGPQAVAWDNVKLSLITPCNDLPFDFDGDGDVDQDDFGKFQACVTGVDAGPVEGDCTCADSDTDTDVDATDLVAFEGCASGPDIPADAGCVQ